MRELERCLGGGLFAQVLSCMRRGGLPVRQPSIWWMGSGCKVPRGERVTGRCGGLRPLALMDTGCGDELGKDPSSDGVDVAINFV